VYETSRLPPPPFLPPPCIINSCQAAITVKQGVNLLRKNVRKQQNRMKLNRLVYWSVTSLAHTWTSNHLWLLYHKFLKFLKAAGKLVTCVTFMPPPVVTNLCTRYFENERTDASWFAGQGHETINFRGQKVKGQGHRRPKSDLEAWRRHHSGSLETSRFSRSSIKYQCN